MNHMAYRLQFRRDTAARWQQVNPVLLEGEIGFITDRTNQFKLGDGVHAWNDLALWGFDGTLVHDTGTSATSAMSQKGVTELFDRILRDLGKYATELTVSLSVGKSGKYVDSEGQEKSDSSMSISAPVELKAGNIYLFPASQAVGTGVSLFARQVTRTYDKVIEYETVSEYNDGRPAEIRAKHDPSLRYEVVYQDDSIYYIKLPRPSGNIVGLLHNPQLTYEVTESFYEPLFRTNDSSMPESGSYLYLCPQDMEMVVSAKTSDISGKSLAGIRYGAFASIMTNFLSNFGQKVVAQALAELYARLESLEAQVDKAGHLKVDVLDMADLPLVCGERMYLTGSGAPATPPTVPFQEYFDTENGKFYKAKGVLPDSPTTADWVAIN